MLTKKDIYSRINFDFASSPEIADACLTITEKILSTSPSKLRHLTQRNILRWLNDGKIDRLVNSICYLTGDRVPLLEMKFEFIEDEEIIQISNEALAEADKTGILLHPTNKVPVENYKEKIFPYFVLTSIALSLNDSGRN